MQLYLEIITVLPSNGLLQKIEDGVDVLVDIDWQGTRQIQKHIPEDIVKIFILPTSSIAFL